MIASDLKVNTLYQWRHEMQILVYIGSEYPGWYQFATVHTPTEVWCEVNAADLVHFKESNK